MRLRNNKETAKATNAPESPDSVSPTAKRKRAATKRAADTTPTKQQQQGSIKSSPASAESPLKKAKLEEGNAVKSLQLQISTEDLVSKKKSLVKVATREKKSPIIFSPTTEKEQKQKQQKVVGDAKKSSVSTAAAFSQGSAMIKSTIADAVRKTAADISNNNSNRLPSFSSPPLKSVVNPDTLSKGKEKLIQLPRSAAISSVLKKEDVQLHPILQKAGLLPVKIEDKCPKSVQNA